MDFNLWQQLILGATKPFRTGANILAQNYGSALTGKDMSQKQNQTKFLKWLAGGITPEEQQEITDKPYLSALKSGAGMASTLAPFGTQGLRATQFATNPLTNKVAQLASQGALEGGLGGFGLSRQGKEIGDTLTGAGIGAGGELLAGYLFNPQFRKMVDDASTYQGPDGKRWYRGALGDDDFVSYQDDPSTMYRKGFEPEPEITGVEKPVVDPVDLDNPVIDMSKDPTNKLELEAIKYDTPEEFMGKYDKYYRGQNTKYGSRGLIIPNKKVGAVYGTIDPEIATEYGDEILEIYTKPNKIYEAEDRVTLAKKLFNLPKTLSQEDEVMDALGIKVKGPVNPYDEVEKVIVKKLKAKGYDAIKYKSQTFDTPEIVVFNPKKVFTSQQLRKIWDNAWGVKNSMKELKGGFKDILEKASKDGIK